MTNPLNTETPFDFTPFWPFLQDAMRCDPGLAQLMADPVGGGEAADWETPDSAGEDTPSGHGSDRGICITKGKLAITLTENEAKEWYENLPMLENYNVQLENTDPVHLVIRTVKLEHGAFEVLVS